LGLFLVHLPFALLWTTNPLIEPLSYHFQPL
jgi:hypothetical protein